MVEPVGESLETDDPLESITTYVWARALWDIDRNQHRPRIDELVARAVHACEGAEGRFLSQRNELEQWLRTR